MPDVSPAAPGVTVRSGKAEPPTPMTDNPAPRLRPRDAGTLILLRRRAAGSPEVLMGRRHPDQAFAPDNYVFPGGRVDPEDGKVRPLAPLRAEVAERLAKSCTGRRARALAMAAVRETFEETGLMLGRPLDGARPRGLPDSWRHFYAAGLGPALDGLAYFARAITPAGRTRRFDARFFVADADGLTGELIGNGELLDLQWVTLDDALDLQIREITAIMIERLRTALEAGMNPATDDAPAPVYRLVRGRRSITYD